MLVNNPFDNTETKHNVDNKMIPIDQKDIWTDGEYYYVIEPGQGIYIEDYQEFRRSVLMLRHYDNNDIDNKSVIYDRKKEEANKQEGINKLFDIKDKLMYWSKLLENRNGAKLILDDNQCSMLSELLEKCNESIFKRVDTSKIY